MGTLTILLHPHFPRRYDNSTSHQHGPKKCPIYLHLFNQIWKSKLLQPFSVITLLLKHLLFLQPGLFFPQPRRMYYLPITTIILSINFCAAAIIGTIVGTSQWLQERIKQTCFQVDQKPSFFSRLLYSFSCLQEKQHFKSPPITLLLDSIFWKTLPVPANIVTPNSLSLPEDLLLSISPLLNLRSSNFFNQISVDTRNFFKFKTHSLTLFYFHF